MAFIITKAEALRIQSEHIEWYAKIYGEHVRELVAAATTADKLADGEHDIVTINQHIPRGGAIESLIPEKRAHEEAIKARATALRTSEPASPSTAPQSSAPIIRSLGLVTAGDGG